MNYESQPAYRHRNYQTAIDQQIATHRDTLVSLLDTSSLSSDDKQQLRKMSADYLTMTATLPDDEQQMRVELLDYVTSSVPVNKHDGEYGLRRTLSEAQAPVILIDGVPLAMDQFEVIYTAIEPSREGLDMVTNPLPIIEASEITPQPDKEADEDDDKDYDIFEYEATAKPAIEETHTFQQELILLHESVAKMGAKVLSLVGAGSLRE